MFKNLSNRVSAKTIEETYTENDVEHVKDEHGKETTDISLNYIPNTGFTFDYPQRWLNEETDFKAIGIRRLKVVPTSHVFSLNIGINYKFKNYDSTIMNKEPHIVRELYYSASITSNNTLEEIIHDLIYTLNVKLHETYVYFYSDKKGEDVLDEADVLGAYMVFTYTFDYKTGDFTLKLSQTTDKAFDILEFSIDGSVYDNIAKDNLDFFLKFLNQERTDANRSLLTDYSDSKHFTNVWDRSSLQFHASFSNNRRNFIGLNNDFYDCPSVFYDPPTNKSDFWIKFTTDGKHQFIPRYCRFYIGLSFVRNYKNSLVTK
jgi:hypothetical protein